MNTFASQLTLSSDSAVDLQLHTTYSDGLWTPQQLIDYLDCEQFDLIAVTDHDRVDTVASIQQSASRKHLPVLAAVEMTTSWSRGGVDLLCFGFDPVQNELDELAQRVTIAREVMVQEMYENLMHQGYTFSQKHEVLAAHSGSPRIALDIARLLHHHGYLRDWGMKDIILDELGNRDITNDLAIVVDAAHRCGAVCIIAHPGRGCGYPIYDPALLDQLLAVIPIDGVEAFYPMHTPEQVEMYVEYARKHDLLISSGSDSHGALDEQKPIKYRAELSRRLLERVGIRFR